MDGLWSHQAQEAEDLSPARALFWEQGTGKTRTSCEIVRRLFAQGRIDGALVIMPNGLEKQWKKEFEDMGMQAHIAKSSGKRDRFIFDALEFMRMPIMLTTYSFCATRESGRSELSGLDRLKRTFAGKRIIIILDESSKIKSLRSRQSVAVRELGKIAEYRRILDGTPVDTSPVDLFTQLSFLDHGILSSWGVGSSTAFKSMFFKSKKVYTSRRSWRTRYLEAKNLHLLTRMLETCSSRYRISDIMDLPPKLYSILPFELPAEQRRDYDKLEEELMLMNEDFTEMVLAEQPIVLAIRLAQVSCGFVGLHDGGVKIYKQNPRLENAAKRLNDSNEQWIVWTRFIRDVNNLLDVLGEDAVRYDGQVDAKTKEENLDTFKAGGVKILLANTQALAFGHNLQHCWNNLYYSYTGSLRLRRQSEARTSRPGQDRTVTYATLEAEDTIDRIFLDRQLNRKDIARQVMQDKD